jgi:hypothetical protein
MEGGSGFPVDLPFQKFVQIMNKKVAFLPENRLVFFEINTP